MERQVPPLFFFLFLLDDHLSLSSIADLTGHLALPRMLFARADVSVFHYCNEVKFLPALKKKKNYKSQYHPLMVFSFLL